LVLAVGILMASTLRYYSFKDIQWQKRHSSLRVVVLAGIGGAVVFYSKVTLLLMASIYVAHGPVLQLIRMIRHRRSSRPA
jgi:phosphatidylserine synthase